MMMALSQRQIEEFLAARRHAIVGTISSSGSPQLSPVWYLYEEGRFYISVSAATAKFHNLRRDPRITLCIDGGYPDKRSVIITGTATLIAADNALQGEMRWRILSHYYDTEAEVRRHIAATADPSRMALIIVAPRKILIQGFPALQRGSDAEQEVGDETDHDQNRRRPDD